MHTAIRRRGMAVVATGLMAAATFACYRGDSLLDPNSAAGYRPPETDVASITLSPTSVHAPAGSQVRIFAAPLGASGSLVPADLVAWVSSNPKMATVSGSGEVSLMHPGSAVITAIADGVTASAAAAIAAPPATSLAVAPATTLIQAGQQVQLTATAFDGNLVDSGVAVNWSTSNSGVASVSATGLVTALAVGAATITASSGAVSGAAAITVVASAPTVASVSVNPASSSIYPGGTEQLSATLLDASGDVLGGIPVTWATSNGSIASVSSNGLVSGNALGSATITASAEGQSGSATVSVTAPVAASVTVSPSPVTLSPGETTQLVAQALDASGTPVSVSMSWASSDAGVASVSQSGNVTAVAIGSATITATAGAASGSADVTVQSGPAGGFHEPAGMVTQVNTGPLTSTAPFTVFSPSTPTATGAWSGNLSLVPDGTGLRITYPTSVVAGNAPVSFGVGIPSPGTGWYYQRMKIRFSANWTNASNPLVKLCEPRTQQTGNPSGPDENHVISGFVNAGPTQSFLTILLQGPNGHFRDLFAQPTTNPRANLSDGNWHLMEVLFGPESTPGAGNGTYVAWVDGVQIASYNNVLWLAPGNNIGWPYLLFQPIYGGVQSSPPYTMYWDLDQLYVSTR
jgi:uncharacterized protein YjdB